MKPALTELRFSSSFCFVKAGLSPDSEAVDFPWSFNDDLISQQVFGRIPRSSVLSVNNVGSNVLKGDSC